MNETNGNPRREVLRLETNVPVVTSLMYEGPLGPYPGRYGDQMMYTLNTEAGEKVIYLDPPVSDMIQKLGLKRGEPFRIGKMTRKDGNRRGVEWKVRRLEPEEMAPAVESGGAALPLPPSSNGTAHHMAPGAPEREPNSPQPTTPAPQPGPAPHTGPRPHTPVPFAGSQHGQYMLSALVNMIDLCAAAEQYAQAKGMELHFSGEDVRALAITSFIQHNKEGGR